MSTAIKTVEHMKILHDMGNGLLNRLYYIKVAFISKRKPQCLADPEWSKLRARMEKKFPGAPEAQKVISKAGWLVDIPLVADNIAPDPICRLLAGMHLSRIRQVRCRNYRSRMTSSWMLLTSQLTPSKL
jgi:hypothetical protein